MLDKQTDTLRLLAWSGYNDKNFRELLMEFYESTFDRQLCLEIEEYSGGDELLEKLRSDAHPDMIVADYELIRLLKDRVQIRASCVKPEDIAKYYFSRMQETFPVFGDLLFGIPIRWGVVAISSLAALDIGGSNAYWDTIKECKHVGLFTPNRYYLPLMSVLALTINPERPFALNPAELNELESRLSILVNRGGMILDQFSDAYEAISTGKVDCVIGAGDWTISYLKKKNIDKHSWSCSDREGAIIFMECLAIPRLSTIRPEVEKSVIHSFLSSKVLYRLTSLNASNGYHSNLMNAQQVEMASSDGRSKILRVTSEKDFEDLWEKSRFKNLPFGQYHVHDESQWRRIYDTVLKRSKRK
jgi:spermidine/putrescine-binding protein